jgi:uncharacterized protein YneF (UPF0154 family)
VPPTASSLAACAGVPYNECTQIEPDPGKLFEEGVAMQLALLNYLAILVAAVGTFILGALWYSPALFAKSWVKAHGYSEEELKAMRARMGPRYAAALVCDAVIAFGVAVLVQDLHLVRPVQGLKLGLLVGVCFLAANALTGFLFSNKKIGAWVIDAGYQVVFSVWMGFLLTVWR